MIPSRRSLLKTVLAGSGASLAGAVPTGVEPDCTAAEASLDGVWQFHAGAEETAATGGWRDVTVPHTWQVMPGLESYLGIAWYRRTLDAPAEWKGQVVRIEFEAVFHSAWVWVNGKPAGAHIGKGYTAFRLDISRLLEYGRANIVTVKVDNSFDGNMLPRGRSYDWTPDGGIYRPVRLLITPPVFLERVDVNAVPDLSAGTAAIEVRLDAENHTGTAVALPCEFEIVDEETGNVAARHGEAAAQIGTGLQHLQPISITVKNPKLWHFDHPHLYRLRARLGAQAIETTFGIRRIETRDGGLYLNGERVRLMGVERMAGSNPEFGMAEPASWIEHDHNDLKELNCVFTRVHWQQDRRVLDYCDRHGILIQEEVPTWGGRTFSGADAEPPAKIMQNGLEQLREMIARDRNHPSIFAWGLCNEVGGDRPAAAGFARRMYQEAKILDPGRLLTYASNSLYRNPAKDVAGAMDFVSWNEYYETWFGGTPAVMETNLEEIHRAFPGKMVVISEYGYCECTPDRLGGDAARIRILREHDEIFRKHDWVGGLIFFCYNDYRTQMGDKGLGVMQQRVHGVVDLYGQRKSSFDVLRHEASPVESIDWTADGGGLEVKVRTRRSIPAYTLDGYTLRWIVYGFDDLPMERHEAKLPGLTPGGEASVRLEWKEKAPRRVMIDVMRPTGFSAFTAAWKPQ